MIQRILSAGLIFALLACQPVSDQPSTRQPQDKLSAGQAAASVRRTVPADGLEQRPARWIAERAYDLTGDNRPERLLVQAEGPSFDQLEVRLQIINSSGETLFQDQWSSSDYFYLEPVSEVGDTAVRVVRYHLDNLLRDDAFLLGSSARTEDGEELVDTAHLRYELASQGWRQRHGTPSSPRLAEEAQQEVDESAVTQSEVVDFTKELRGKRSFHYYAGAEAHNTIVWSDRLGRFVSVFSCC